MNTAMAAGAMAYSMRIAVPVRKPPQARRRCGQSRSAAGGGDHRGQLGQREAHAQVHGGHQQGGEEHAAPAALGQAEVPAGVVAGNHVGHAQADQQDPAGGAFFQFTLLEILGIDLSKSTEELAGAGE
jgi:hypothetical protein